MDPDFTLKRYEELVKALKCAGYEFRTFKEFVDAPDGICLRHDVDLRPGNSLVVARLERRLGVRASYYFRAVPESWNEDIIREIASLGHEVGYHYESLTTCGGDVDAAYEDFCWNLGKLRALAPVSTICMHGSPRSPYDSKDIWKKYDYKSLGISYEPYLDTDWSDTFYLTDTGRRWDGYKVSVRDKIPHWQEVWDARGLRFRTTADIIARASSLPGKIMITTHPQRWTGNFVAWGREMLLQRAKNIVKTLFVVSRAK